MPPDVTLLEQIRTRLPGLLPCLNGVERAGKNICLGLCANALKPRQESQLLQTNFVTMCPKGDHPQPTPYLAFGA